MFIEEDHGDPWATRSLRRDRRPVTVNADGIRVVKGRGFVDVIVPGTGRTPPLYSAQDPWTIQMEFVQRWRFYERHEFIDVRTEIEWSSYDRRVRLSFPTAMKTDRMWTEIPFGVIERERYEMQGTHWNNASGDWPCIGWAAVEERGRGFSVLNKGTPSVRTERGVLLVSALRSPTFPNCLEEPDCYSAPVYDGMRDAGRHVFEHRLVAYEGTWREAGLVDLAREFNQAIPAAPAIGEAPVWPFGQVPPGVIVAAVKKPRQGRGLVLRQIGRAHV